MEDRQAQRKRWVCPVNTVPTRHAGLGSPPPTRQCTDSTCVCPGMANCLTEPLAQKGSSPLSRADLSDEWHEEQSKSKVDLLLQGDWQGPSTRRERWATPKAHRQADQSHGGACRPAARTATATSGRGRSRGRSRARQHGLGHSGNQEKSTIPECQEKRTLGTTPDSRKIYPCWYRATTFSNGWAQNWSQGRRV